MQELLRRANITVSELAEWLNVTERTIYHYCSGARTPPSSTVLLLEYLADNPKARPWFAKRSDQTQKRQTIYSLPSFRT